MSLIQVNNKLYGNAACLSIRGKTFFTLTFDVHTALHILLMQWVGRFHMEYSLSLSQSVEYLECISLMVCINPEHTLWTLCNVYTVNHWAEIIQVFIRLQWNAKDHPWIKSTLSALSYGDVSQMSVWYQIHDVCIGITSNVEYSEVWLSKHLEIAIIYMYFIDIVEH